MMALRLGHLVLAVSLTCCSRAGRGGRARIRLDAHRIETTTVCSDSHRAVNVDGHVGVAYEEFIFGPSTPEPRRRCWTPDLAMIRQFEFRLAQAIRRVGRGHLIARLDAFFRRYRGEVNWEDSRFPVGRPILVVELLEHPPEGWLELRTDVEDGGLIVVLFDAEGGEQIECEELFTDRRSPRG